MEDFELRERHRAAGFLNEQRAKLFGIIRDLGSHGAQNVAARAGREIAPGRKGRLGGGNGAFDVGRIRIGNLGEGNTSARIDDRSDEHTSELQSLMSTSYA